MRRQPNILLFMPDQLRSDWAGPNNAGRVRTPHVDRLAARGVTFRNAVCPSPICGPSRACLATGMEFDRTPVRYNGQNLPLQPNLYRCLREAGYAVLTCGKLDLLKGAMDWGADGRHVVDGVSQLEALGFTGGLDSGGKHAVIFAARAGQPEPYSAFLQSRGLEAAHLADYARRESPALGVNAERHPGAGPNYRNTRPTPLPDDAYNDNWVAQSGLGLIRDAGDHPWFLQVNLPGPHEPMDVTAAMAAGVSDREPPLPASLGGLDAETHRAVRRNYTAMIENTDRLFGQYMALLEETGQLENTLVIFTSDHGEMLGDCGYWEKFIPHQRSIGVPLVIAGPGVATGAVVDAPTTLLDLHATLSEFAGAAAIPGVDSRSLRAQLAEPSLPHRDVVLSGLGRWRAAFDGRFKLVAGFDPGDSRSEMGRGRFDPAAAVWRLVEPAADPCEENDRSAAEPGTFARLRAAVLASFERAIAVTTAAGPAGNAPD